MIRYLRNGKQKYKVILSMRDCSIRSPIFKECSIDDDIKGEFTDCSFNDQRLKVIPN